MLKRILTALILAPLVFLFFLKANGLLFLSVIGIVTLLLGWEWTRLIALVEPLHQVLFLVGLSVSMIFFYVAGTFLLFPLFLFWFPFLLMIPWYPVSQSIWGHQLIVALLGLLFLPLFALSLLIMRQSPFGNELLLYLLFLVWAADTGAYFSGKFLGRHPLILQVSPRKTWEGVIGGLLSVLLLAGVAESYFLPVHRLAWYLLAIFVMCLSLAGDLFISMLKRRVLLKDTGNLLPGHGGLLDRLDSLLPSAPLFCLALQCHVLTEDTFFLKCMLG